MEVATMSNDEAKKPEPIRRLTSSVGMTLTAHQRLMERELLRTFRWDAQDTGPGGADPTPEEMSFAERAGVADWLEEIAQGLRSGILSGFHGLTWNPGESLSGSLSPTQRYDRIPVCVDLSKPLVDEDD